MKNIIYSVILFFAVGLPVKADTIHVVSSSSDVLRLSINDAEFDQDFSFVRNIDDNKFDFRLHADTIDLRIYSDTNTLCITVPTGSHVDLSIQVKDAEPYYVTFSNEMELTAISFTGTGDPGHRIIYDTNPDSPYLTTLREKYKLGKLCARAHTYFDKVLTISGWVNRLWKHNGSNEPKKSDALSILEEVEQGAEFQCVEYGIVTAACLKALGLPARVLALKTKDVATRPSGAGHVVMEVYLNDLQKWIMVDPQFDAIVLKDCIPLNAVEIQAAATNGEKLTILTSNPDTPVEYYISWVYPYLYYFDTPFDNREDIKKDERHKVNGKTNLMLVPTGAPEPVIFQNRIKINWCEYTRSITDFYAPPL